MPAADNDSVVYFKAAATISASRTLTLAPSLRDDLLRLVGQMQMLNDSTGALFLNLEQVEFVDMPWILREPEEVDVLLTKPSIPIANQADHVSPALELHSNNYGEFPQRVNSSAAIDCS